MKIRKQQLRFSVQDLYVLYLTAIQDDSCRN